MTPHANSEDCNLLTILKRLYELVPEGVMCFDENQRITMVNNSMLGMFGYRHDELFGSNTSILCQGDGLDERWLRGPLAIDSGESVFKAELVTRDGTIVPVQIISTRIEDGNRNFICFLNIIRNISMRQKLLRDMHLLDTRFTLLAEFAYNWESLTLTDGQFVHVSPSCERISGYTREQFISDPLLMENIIVEEDRELWRQHLEDADKGCDHRELQLRIKHRNGEIRWLEHSCHTIYASNGQKIGHRATNQDITQRKNYEQKLLASSVEIYQYQQQLKDEQAYLQEEVNVTRSYDNIVGQSNALQYVFFKIEQIAASDTTVLLLGETGTGKSLFANAIHATSSRRKQPIIKLNCATLPPNLIESELFGHEKGSFTNAHSLQIGRFELADKATIFLDEIGELPLELQAKLLRVLQDGEFERLGSSKTIKVNVRIIAATNRDLEDDVRKGLFRKDLWYRLNVFPITAPPLRDRRDDIPHLVHYFVNQFSRQQRKEPPQVPRSTMEKLVKYSWPGNIRELENVIERAILTTIGSKLHLTDSLMEDGTAPSETSLITLEEMERQHIIKVLEHTDWKVSGQNSAAEILGLKRSTLRAKIDKLQICRKS